LNKKNSEPVEFDVLAQMNRTLVHRGPDGEGIWMSEDRTIGFAHRRLKIIDLTEAARQPMCNEDGTIWITFNGEIYNHLELRRELQNMGHLYNSSSDTETIMHAYEEWGIECLQRFDGMFAFGLWDARARKLFLVRDRIGKKPLCYAVFDNSLIFASEPKSILAHPGYPREMDLDAFYDFLSFCAVPAPRTMFKGINKIPAAHYLVWSPEQSPQVVRYWDAFEASQKRFKGISFEEGEAIGEVRRLLRTAVQKRLISDVPFGAFLSGGIDSSAIVAMMASMMDRPVDTFSVAIAGQDQYNEFSFAKQVADLFQTNHREVVITEDDFVAFLDQLCYYQDDPAADPVSVPLYYLSNLTRQSGTIVVLVGEGSDELFFGYPPYIDYVVNKSRTYAAFQRLPAPIRYIAGETARILRPKSQVIPQLRDGREPFWGGAIALGEEKKRALINMRVYQDHDSYSHIAEYQAVLESVKAEYDSADYVNALDFFHRLPELLLMRADRMGMANSIELRVPFLDHCLIEFAVALPFKMRVNGGTTKALLKKALRGIIPDLIIDRPKTGFGGSWNNMVTAKVVQLARTMLIDEPSGLQHYLNIPHLRELFALPHEKIPKGAVWVLLNAGLWYRRWIETEP
jgi:asparagine synthase (glutamine-hydrolysing)